MQDKTDELKKIDIDVREKVQELNVSLMLQGEFIQKQVGKHVVVRMRGGQTINGKLKNIWYIFDPAQRECSGIIRDAYPVFVVETWRSFCRRLRWPDIDSFQVQD